MSKAQQAAIDVVIAFRSDLEGLAATLGALSTQHMGGSGFSVIVCAHSSVAEAATSMSAASSLAEKIRVIESAGESHGVLLNAALASATARYVAVVSPGELLSARSLARMLRALEHAPDLDVAFVAARAAESMLDPSYVPPRDRRLPEASTILDVSEDWFSARNCFRGTLLRRSALPEKLDESAWGRDCECEAMLSLQVANPHLAFVCGEVVTMLYLDEYQSRLSPAAWEEDWYRGPLARSWPAWMESLTRGGKVPLLVQAAALAAVAARFKANQDNLNKQLLLGEDLDGFLARCAGLLGQVDPAFMLAPETGKLLGVNRALALTLYLTRQRCGEVAYGMGEAPSPDEPELVLPCTTVDGHPFEFVDRQEVRVSLIDFDPVTREVIVDGKIKGFSWLAAVPYRATVLTVGADGRRKPAKQVELRQREWYSLTKHFGVATTKTYAFRLRVPVTDDFKSLEIGITAGEETGEPLRMAFVGHYTKIARYPRRMWWSFDRYYMRYRKRRISIRPRSLPAMLVCEAVVMLSLLRGSKHKSRRSYNRAAAFKRLAYWLTKPWYSGKPTWFFFDKIYKAGDSSEYLFRYASGKDDGIEKHYAIHQSSGDFRRLVADGFKPVKAGSLGHLLRFLHADLVFASNSTVCSLNGLKSWRSNPYRGFIDFDTVCVQHGLSVQKIAIAQNRLVDNTRLYLLASEAERDNLSRPVYAYDDYPGALTTTGIPRYDGLVPDDRKQILIHPTWRMQHAVPVITHEGEKRPYNPLFKESPYFKVYSALISNEKLIACARETGYSIKYVLHPIASSQVSDFPVSDDVEIIGASGQLNYEEVLSQSSLMVTDYSGVQFDFAYMRKPIVYYHPPSLPPHYAEGVFHYDTMAFGEICEAESELVDVLCGYMRHGCEMKPAFEQRVNDFFVHDDRRNCERAYEAAFEYMQAREERR